MNRSKFNVLSIAAMAALASCSLNEEVVPELQNKAPEAKVILKLEGEPETKARGALPETDNKNGTVNNLTVFIFNAGGDILKKVYIGTPAAAGANTVTTTTDAAKVSVVANAGNQLSTGGLFYSVSTETALKEVLGNLLSVNPVTATPSTQNDTNLYMSGSGMVGAFAPGTGDDKSMRASATVQLSFIAARIQFRKITYVNSNKYVPSDQFDGNENANFTISRIYLMNVQRVSRFFKVGPENASYYITQPQKQFTGGMPWTTPWTGSRPNGFVDNNEYRIPGPDLPPSLLGTGSNRIENIGHWYVFANSGVADISKRPTVIVVEVKWRKKAAAAGVAHELLTRYFTIYFGGGDQVSEILAGKTYDVTMALNGNFKTEANGGNGGGGTVTPDRPTVNSNVQVTITPAAWGTPITIEKAFN